MDINSSTQTARIPQSFSLSQHGLSGSVLKTEVARVPVAKHADSFAFSDKVHTTHPSPNTLEPFEDKNAAAAKEYESGLIKSPFAEEPSASVKPSANQESQEAKEQEETSSESEKSAGNENSLSNKDLTEDEILEVEELKRRDTEVRSHEQAHMSAAGNLAQGGANFSFETGPDGKRYAVGGDVSIDTSAVAGDPQATLRKAQQIRRAASAPVDPSPQDRSVAAQASRMEVQARVEISQQARDKQVEYIGENTPEIDFLGPKKDKNEQNIQDTYAKIQNTSVLEEQRSFVDFFI